MQEVVEDLKFQAANKKFLETSEIPFVLPARPYILSIKEDRDNIREFGKMV
jgi:hypothetical protein